MADRLDAAITSFRTVLSLSPGIGGAHTLLGSALLLKGDAPGALAEIEQETSEIYRMIGMPMAYHIAGRKADSDAALAADREYERTRPQHCLRLRLPRQGRPGVRWLDKAVEYGDGGLGEIVTDNLFDNIPPTALASVPAQDRQGAGAVGEDRVQSDAAGGEAARRVAERITCPADRGRAKLATPS